MIHAVILAGGWGRRFWPKSRQKLPKQLLCFGRRYSPVQELFNILKAQIPKERIWVVANKEHTLSLRKQLPSLPRRNVLEEPLPKNTACAIGLAALAVKRVNPEAVTVVLSSDQLVRQKGLFLEAIKEAAAFAREKDVLVTIGVRPHRPATEFGYLKLVHSSEFIVHSSKIYKVEKFIEKPTLAKAKRYIKNKNYLWNAGIFAWKADAILKAIKRHLPQTYAGLQRIEKVWGRPNFKNRLQKEYRRFQDISIDYGVMEKAGNVYAVRAEFTLHDLGAWGSLSRDLFSQDRHGNVVCGLHRGMGSCNSLIFSEGKHLIATLGVRDLIIVHTPTATLVCKTDQAQDVKKLTQILEKDKQLKKYL